MPEHLNPRWTVMVFMGADTVDGEAPLLKEAKADIAEMRNAITKTDPEATLDPDPTRAHLNVFVQLHGPNYVEREHIGHGPAQRLSVDPIKATNGEALIEFVDESLRTANHQRDDYSMLVLWGHAYQFAIARARVGAGQDALDFAELANVLRRFQRKHKEAHKGAYHGDELPRLDIVGFDACDIATVEMSVQLHEFVRYLLASQITIPLPGWPYDRILDRLRKPLGRIMGPAEFGTYVVRRYCETYSAEKQTVSLTLLDLKRAPELFGLTEVLALRLAQAIGRDADGQRTVRDLFVRSRTDHGKPFVDVADLCLSLVRYTRDPFLSDAAASLGDLLITPPPTQARAGQSITGARRPFVVEHGRNSGRTARLHGVSLYAPHVTGNGGWEQATHWYNKFVFAQNTVWSKLVHALALSA